MKRIYDREIALEAVKENCYAIKYLSDELKNDREIVLEAIKQDSYALKYLSDELRNDREIVLEAVKQNYNAFQYLCDEYCNNAEDYKSLLKYFEAKDLKEKLEKELTIKDEIIKKKVFKI